MWARTCRSREPGVDEKLKALEAAGHPVIRLAMNDEYDLGEQFYLWEIAVAAAGSILQIDAFDQPNVQESKDNTVALLEQYAKNGKFSRAAGRRFGRTLRRHVSLRQQADRRQDPVQALAALLGELKDGRLQRDHGVYRAQRDARGPLARPAREDPRRAQGRDHGRIRTALPPLDRPAAQGRPGPSRHHADHLRRSGRSADSRV